MTHLKPLARWLATHLAALGIGVAVGHTTLARDVMAYQRDTTEQLMCVSGYMAYCKQWVGQPQNKYGDEALPAVHIKD